MKQAAGDILLEETAKRLLVVDDEVDHLVAVMDVLESRGYEVQVAYDGEQAEERIKHFDAQVALLDNRLGRRSGADLIPKLRELRPRILCVIVTAYADTDSAVEALQKGAYDYLRKPVDPRELLSTLDRCFEKIGLEDEKAAAEEAMRAQNRRLIEFNARLKAIVETTKKLASRSSLREMSCMILDEFASNLSAKGGSFYLLENDSLVLTHALDSGHAPELIRLPPKENTVFHKVLTRRTPFLVRDADQEPNLVRSGWHGYRNGSALILPICLDGGDAIGLVSLHDKEQPPFTDQDREIGMILASYTCEALRAAQALEELHTRESRFRQLYDQAPVMMHSTNQEGTLINVNAKWSETMGYTLDEVRGRDISHFVTQRSSEMLSLALPDFWKRGEAQTAEIQLVRRDGGIIDALLDSATITEQKAGTISLSVLRDVTNQKKSERALIESEERFRSLFSRMLNGFVYFRILNDDQGVPQDYVLMDANVAFERLTGLASQDLIGRRLSEVLREITVLPSSWLRPFRTVALTGEEVAFQRYSEFARRWYSLAAFMPQKGFIATIVEDITVRKTSEEERLRLVTAIEQAGDTIEIADAQGRIVYVNPAFEHTTGYNRDEAIGSKPSMLKSGTHRQEFYEKLWETITNGRVWKGHFVNKKKDGTLYEEEATIAPVKDDYGGIVNYVAVKRDVTQEALLQKQLLHAQKMEAVGALAGGVAHDFNNLLQVILGYSEIALLGISRGEQGYNELQEVRKAALSACELTQSLLTFSRKVESKLRPVNLNQELRQVAKMLERTLPKMIKIQLRLGEPLHAVEADPAQLQQVVMNLAVNARDAMPDGGTLTIETANAQLDTEYCRSHLGTGAGDYVLLAVTDNGCGIARENLERIFEPFFTTKEAGKGTGLGLAIVYGIVKAHRGNIVCYSEPGKGTSFKAFWPAAERIGAEPEHPSEPLVGGTETILLVDDEEAIRKLGKRILSSFGYNVLTAVNGADGLRIFSEEKEKISLVILDLIMPEMGGRECLTEILRTDPKAKVLIASGYAADGEIDASLRKGAMAYIRKPYEAGPMLQLVRSLLDKE